MMRGMFAPGPPHPPCTCAVFGVHRDGHLVPMFLNVERTDTCFAAVSHRECASQARSQFVGRLPRFRLQKAQYTSA